MRNVSVDQGDPKHMGENTRNSCHHLDWYLINTKPHQEKVAALSLGLLGVETFCPYLKQSSMGRMRKPTNSAPLFPGYLFSRFDVSAQHRLVDYAHGVRKLVRFGSNPAKVDEVIIESIKTRIPGEHPCSCPVSFATGQALRIEDGPLCGLEAVFEKNLSGQQRVALLLRTVSYQARVVIDRGQVTSL